MLNSKLEITCKVKNPKELVLKKWRTIVFLTNRATAILRKQDSFNPIYKWLHEDMVKAPLVTCPSPASEYSNRIGSSVEREETKPSYSGFVGSMVNRLKPRASARFFANSSSADFNLGSTRFG